MSFKVSATALRDVQQGVDYYQAQRKGLGRKFEIQVQATFKRIREYPYSASFIHEGVRYKVMDRYPYIILYEFDGGNIYILRVYNTHQSAEKM